MRIQAPSYKTATKRWQPGLYLSVLAAASFTPSAATVREWLVQNPYAIGLSVQYPWSMYETAPSTYDFAGTFGGWLDKLADWSVGGADPIDGRQFYMIGQLSHLTFVGRQCSTPLHYIPSTHSWFVESSNDPLYKTWQVGTGAPGLYDGCVLDLIGVDPGSSRVIKPHWQDLSYSRAYGGAMKRLAQDFAAHDEGHRLVAMVSSELAVDPESEVGGIWQHKLNGHHGTVANQAAMVALSSALPGDTCYRSDTASVWMLKSGGTYSTAADWLDSAVAGNHTAMLSWQSLRTYRNAFSAPYNTLRPSLGEAMSLAYALEVTPELVAIVRSASSVRFEDLVGSQLYGFGTGTPDVRAASTEANHRSQLRMRMMAARNQTVIAETQSNSWWAPFDGTQSTVSLTFDRVDYTNASYLVMLWTPSAPDGVTVAQWQDNVLAELAIRGGPEGFLNYTNPY